MNSTVLLDTYGRRINYLRVSVTDRCNMRCLYCMPPEGVTLIPRSQILSFEEIFEFASVAAAMGVDKLRLTGGEPLVRRDVVTLVAMLARIPGIIDFAMSTNGILLDRFARPLAEAGLQRVNVSLDSLDPRRYSEITRGGDLSKVLAGIAAARSAGLEPVKLNCVVLDSSDRSDAAAVAEFARREGLQVRFIRRMNLGAGEFHVVQGGTGGDCIRCNRLRLSSDGFLRPCLFSDIAFSVRELGPRAAIERAVRAKPPRGVASLANTFYTLGG